MPAYAVSDAYDMHLILRWLKIRTIPFSLGNIDLHARKFRDKLKFYCVLIGSKKDENLSF